MGRPRKEEGQHHDAEITPQYKHQLKLAKEKEEMKERYTVSEEFFIQNGDKILKCFKKKNGNVVRMFAFKATKHPDALKKIKESGQFRI